MIHCSSNNDANNCKESSLHDLDFSHKIKLTEAKRTEAANTSPQTTTTTTTTAAMIMAPPAATERTTKCWSGLETCGMMEANCSLLLAVDASDFQPKVKYLPKQRVLILQDNKKARQERSKTKSFFVDFPGCDILQLEETPRVMAMVDHKNIKYGDADPNHKMPGVPAVTLTVAGKCHFTSSNYRHFKSMMRTKEESQQLKIPPNGRFDWPGVESMLKCPFCNEMAKVSVLQRNSARPT